MFLLHAWDRLGSGINLIQFRRRWLHWSIAQIKKTEDFKITAKVTWTLTKELWKYWWQQYYSMCSYILVYKLGCTCYILTVTSQWLRPSALRSSVLAINVYMLSNCTAVSVLFLSCGWVCLDRDTIALSLQKTNHITLSPANYKAWC